MKKAWALFLTFVVLCFFVTACGGGGGIEGEVAIHGYAYVPDDSQPMKSFEGGEASFYPRDVNTSPISALGEFNLTTPSYANPLVIRASNPEHSTGSYVTFQAFLYNPSRTEDNTLFVDQFTTAASFIMQDVPAEYSSIFDYDELLKESFNPATPAGHLAYVIKLSVLYPSQFSPGTSTLEQPQVKEARDVAVRSYINYHLLEGSYEGGILHGNVHDASGSPINGVKVVLVGSHRTITTSSMSNGNYQLSNVPYGVQWLRFEKPGYGVKVVKAPEINRYNPTAEVNVVLYPVDDNAPEFQSISVDRDLRNVPVGEEVRIEVVPLDADGDEVTCSFTAYGGEVDGDGCVATFTPSSSGYCMVRITLNDGTYSSYKDLYIWAVGS